MKIRTICCWALAAVLTASVLCGCGQDPMVPSEPENTEAAADGMNSTAATEETVAAVTAPTETDAAKETELQPTTQKETEPTRPGEAPIEEPTETPTEGPSEAPTQAPTESDAQTPTEAVRQSYTVEFRDHDGSILAVRRVEPGGDAALPPDPVRSGYVFAGWQGEYRNVNADATVTAAYAGSSAPNLFVIGSTKTGSTVRVTIRLTGTVNTCAVEARLDYDESVLRYTGLTKHNGAEANHVNGQLILVYAMPRNVTAETLKDGGVLLEAAFEVIDPDCADTEIRFLEDSMLVDSVDDNGAYHSEAFTLTKGVIHLQ